MKWSDYIWIACLTTAVVLVYLRKLILAQHGHPFDLFDMDLKDGQRLRKLAEQQQRLHLKRLYKGVNWGFRLLFLLAIAVLLLTRLGR